MDFLDFVEKLNLWRGGIWMRRVLTSLLLYLFFILVIAFPFPRNADFTLFIAPTDTTRELLGVDDFPPMLIFGRLSLTNQDPALIFRNLREGLRDDITLGSKPLGIVVEEKYSFDVVLNLVENLFDEIGAIIDYSENEKEIMHSSGSVYVLRRNKYWYVCLSREIRQLVLDMLANKVPSSVYYANKDVVFHYKNSKLPILGMIMYLLGDYWGIPKAEEFSLQEEKGILKFELLIQKSIDSYERELLSKFEVTLKGLSYIDGPDYIFGGSGFFGSFLFEFMKVYTGTDLGLSSLLKYFTNYLVSIKYDYELEDYVWLFCGRYLPEYEKVVALLFSPKYARILRGLKLSLTKSWFLRVPCQVGKGSN